MRGNASVAAVLAVLDAWPAGAHELDEDGNTPLHYMMMKKAGVGAVRYSILDRDFAAPYVLGSHDCWG
jgi:hypothetical protein